VSTTLHVVLRIVGREREREREREKEEADRTSTMPFFTARLTAACSAGHAAAAPVRASGATPQCCRTRRNSASAPYYLG